jgi:SWI/SNF-related matrix-associated actin-dependent regulator 1 of chromatin subfamily A
MMNIIDYRTGFRIKIGFGKQFKMHTEAVKSMPQRRWFPEKNQQYWWVPADYRILVEKMAKDFHVPIRFPEHQQPEETGEIPALPDLTIDLPIKATLRHYQRQGVARTIELQRVIIGDEPGLGKTIQSISSLVGAQLSGTQAFPCLVICPSSIKTNWEREWHMFSDYKAVVLTEKLIDKWHQYWFSGVSQVFITNYESLRKFFVLKMPPKGKKFHSSQIELRPTVELFKSVIIDELHRCKDPSTLQSKICSRVTFGKTFRIGLTGTPVVNMPSDLWPQLQIVGRLNDFGGRDGFLKRYCEGGKGSNNTRELHFKLNQLCFFRREKKDVAKDLPEKQRQTILCEISTRQEYSRAKADLKNWLASNGFSEGQINTSLKGEALVKMNALRQISARGKINEVKDFTEEILDAGEKLILFCNLHEIVDQVKSIFPNAVTITGRDTLEQRQRHIDAFQKDPACQLIICNTQAAGVGITLTASSRVAFIEFPWTFAACVQAEDRAHRIGQTNNVMCTYFLGQDTIDERVFQLIQEKKDVSNAITGGTDDMEMKTVDKVLNIFNEL